VLGGLSAVTQLRALWRSWRKLCGRRKVGKEVAVEVVRGVPLQLANFMSERCVHCKLFKAMFCLEISLWYYRQVFLLWCPWYSWYFSRICGSLKVRNIKFACRWIFLVMHHFFWILVLALLVSLFWTALETSHIAQHNNPTYQEVEKLPYLLPGSWEFMALIGALWRWCKGDCRVGSGSELEIWNIRKSQLSPQKLTGCPKE